MNEQELVKWFAPSIKEGLQVGMGLADEAETIEDLKMIQRRLRSAAKELKDCIKMMSHYLQVQESIMNNTSDKDPE